MASLASLPLSSNALAFFSDLGILLVDDILLQDIYSLVTLAEQQLGADEYKQAVADILLFLEENNAIWFDGVDLLNLMQQTVSIISLGCRSLDDLLQGGIRDGMVTELVGPSSSGKTQICIQAAASVILHGDVVVYIDTCNSFSPIRLTEVIYGQSETRSNEDHGYLQNSMKRLLCYRVHDVFSLLELLQRIHVAFCAHLQGSEGPEDVKNVRLIVLDSVSSVIAPVLSSIYVQGHALMMHCGQVLRKLAVQNNISVMVTNHTVGSANGTSKPALGESWKSIPHVRLLLSRDPETDICTASLTKHSSMVCNKQASFQLKEDGIHSL